MCICVCIVYSIYTADVFYFFLCDLLISSNKSIKMIVEGIDHIAMECLGMQVNLS